MNEVKISPAQVSAVHLRRERDTIPLLGFNSSWDLHYQTGDRGQHAAKLLFIIHQSPFLFVS